MQLDTDAAIARATVQLEETSIKAQGFATLIMVCGLALGFSGSALSGGTQLGYWNEFNVDTINGTLGDY